MNFIRLCEPRLNFEVRISPRVLFRYGQNVTLDILNAIASALELDPSELLGAAPIDTASRDLGLLDDAIKGLQVFRSRVRTKSSE